MQKLIISVAPVGHWGRGRNNPVTPDSIAEETHQAWLAGAAMVHLHVRDTRGTQVGHLRDFNRTARLIRERCDIIIQASTGGVSSLTAAQRSVALNAPGVEVATLNMGSTNLFGTVYANSPADILYWARRMQARRIKPECCIFEVGMLAAVDDLIRRGLVAPPPCYNFSLGFPGAMPATRRNLMLLLDSLPPGAPWFYVEHEAHDFRPIGLALALGGHVRVGFEDSQHLDTRTLARQNHELVAKTARLAREIGRAIATPAEARRLLKLPPLP